MSADPCKPALINIGDVPGTGRDIWIDARLVASIHSERGYSYHTTHVSLSNGQKFSTSKFYAWQIQQMIDSVVEPNS